MKYDIVKGNLEALTQPCAPFDFSNPPYNPQELAESLVETMYASNGIGLAAIQCGIPLKVFAMRGNEHNFVCFNPRVVMPSTETIRLEEACLSWPGLNFNIDRSQHVRVRFAGPNGEISTHTFTGLTARVFQHEMTHVNSTVFWEGLKRYKIEKAIKKAKKYGFDYEGKGLLRYAD